MNYAAFNYAYGRISVLESRLLSPSDVERMLGSHDAKEAYRIFNDIDFSDNLGKGDVTDFQKVINAEMQDVKKLLTSIVSDEIAWVMDIFWVSYDFHNLKLALKAKHLGWNEADSRDMLLDLGAIPAREMFDFGFHDKLSTSITDRHIRAKEDAEKMYKDTDEIKNIDFALDRDMHHLISHIARISKNNFLAEFVKKQLDIYNITTYFRLGHAYPDETFCKYFADGGDLPRSIFCNSSKENTLEHLLQTPYARMAKSYQIFGQTDSDFSALEREGDNLLLEHMQKTKHMPLGCEKVFSYFWAKDNNAKVLRMIMVGKLAGLPQDKIRTRLRTLFNN